MSTVQMERPKRQTLKIAQPQLIWKDDDSEEMSMEEIVAICKHVRHKRWLDKSLLKILDEWTSEMNVFRDATGKEDYDVQLMEGIVSEMQQLQNKWREEIVKSASMHCHRYKSVD